MSDGGVMDDRLHERLAELDARVYARGLEIGGIEALREQRNELVARVRELEAALRETPCVLHCNEIGKCAEFGFTCRRCAVLAGVSASPQPQQGAPRPWNCDCVEYGWNGRERVESRVLRFGHMAECVVCGATNPTTPSVSPARSDR
jgi:hypothetical protein